MMVMRPAGSRQFETRILCIEMKRILHKFGQGFGKNSARKVLFGGLMGAYGGKSGWLAGLSAPEGRREQGPSGS
jgi:hypothetical protein